MRVNNQNSILYVRHVIVVSAKYPSAMTMTEPFVRFEQYQKSDGVEEYFEDGNSFFLNAWHDKRQESATLVLSDIGLKT